jgi:microsomal epoxide hydrolase
MRALPIRFALVLALALPLCFAASAATVAEHDRSFVTSDHVRLHLLEAGPPDAHTILFIPGLAMPAWIWQWQIQAFARRYHVIAMDPRGQGRSDVPATGYEPFRRGQDIAEAIAQLDPVPVVIVAWSLGVLDTLAYLHTHEDTLVAGLVLVDNSVGEEPAPATVPVPPSLRPPPPRSYSESMRLFVHGLFHQPQNSAWLDRLTRASLSLPEAADHALRRYPLPRSYWKEAVYTTSRPVLYVVRPRWAAQAENLEHNRPRTETAIFTTAGHALFVDEPARFNALLDSFIRRRIWP